MGIKETPTNINGLPSVISGRAVEREQARLARAARRRELLGMLADRHLVTQLRTLDKKVTAGKADEHERMVRAWLIEEVERRFPAADAAVTAAFEVDDESRQRGENPPEVDYVGVLLAHVNL